MTRTIALLILAQTAAVICSFFGLSIILKHDGYPGEPFQAGSNFVIYHWSVFTLFLRRFGMILLLIPVAWRIVAVKSEHRGEYILSHTLWLVIGTLCPFVIVMTFFYAIFHPCVAVLNR
jgi:hypothetical protein